MGKEYYFAVRLTFGYKSSPKMFDMLSEVIWLDSIQQLRYSPPHPPFGRFSNHFAPRGHPSRPHPQSPKGFFRARDPHRPGKTLGPATSIEFLGINLDSVKFQVSLPKEKIDRIILVASTLIDRQCCCKRDLLSLLGHLNFAMRIIPKGAPLSHISSYSLLLPTRSRT